MVTSLPGVIRRRNTTSVPEVATTDRDEHLDVPEQQWRCQMSAGWTNSLAGGDHISGNGLRGRGPVASACLGRRSACSRRSARSSRSACSGRNPRRPRPVPRRWARGCCRFHRAGGGERCDERHGHRAGPGGLHASGGSFRPSSGETDARAVRRIHPAERGQCHHREVQHSGRSQRWWDYGAVGGQDQRSAPPNTDALVPVRMAVQPVSVLERPGRRSAAPGLVDHRVQLCTSGDVAGPDCRDAVSAESFL